MKFFIGANKRKSCPFIVRVPHSHPLHAKKTNCKRNKRKDKLNDRVYLFAHCFNTIRVVHWLCISYHILNISHGRAAVGFFFPVQSCNSVINICILMNILLNGCVCVYKSSCAWQCSQLATAPLQSSPFAIRYYILWSTSERTDRTVCVFFLHQVLSAFVLQLIFNLDFQFVKMDFYACIWQKKTTLPLSNTHTYASPLPTHLPCIEPEGNIIVQLQFANGTAIFLLDVCHASVGMWMKWQKLRNRKMKMHKCVILNTFITSNAFNIFLITRPMQKKRVEAKKSDHLNERWKCQNVGRQSWPNGCTHCRVVNISNQTEYRHI